MKKIFSLGIILSAIALFTVSCGDDGNGRGDGGTIINADLMFYSAESNFYGPSIDNKGEISNADSYRLWLDDKNLTNDINGDGIYVVLELNTPISNKTEIAPGLYTPDNRGNVPPLTFVPGAWVLNNNNERVVVGSYLAIVKDGKQETRPISNGNININSGRYYTITGVITANNVQYSISYQGAIEMSDVWSPMPQTLTNGELWYNADLFGTGLNLFTIRLWDDNNTTRDFYGSGDAMQIEVYMRTTDSKTKLVNGRYPIVVDSPRAYTAVDGYYDDKAGFDFGTWYYTADYFAINKGYVDVEWLNGSTYDLKFSFTDDYFAHTFTGEFKGLLPFVNMTDEPFAVRSAVKRSIGAAAKSKEVRSSGVSRIKERSSQTDSELRKSRSVK